jgi:divalent metal cation (Fe/Co/Zn/Cd) transporter
MLLLAQQVILNHHYGFLGINGLIGILIGLVIFVVIVTILFKIFNLLLAAVGVPAPWSAILYWVCVLIIFLAFLHFFGLY